jgi:hypothetical protein
MAVTTPEASNLAQIEKHCDEILNSPYMRKELPEELQNLRSLLGKVLVLVREEVPGLVAETRRLRNLNKRLEAELEALRSAK